MTTSLRLKNGSPRFPRRFKVRFFNEDGTLAAASERMQLPAHGSLNSALTSFLPVGATWTAGSVEIVFVGPGGGKILGFGIQTNSSLQTETSVPLQNGGLRHNFEDKKKK